MPGRPPSADKLEGTQVEKPPPPRLARPFRGEGRSASPRWSTLQVGLSTPSFAPKTRLESRIGEGTCTNMSGMRHVQARGRAGFLPRPTDGAPCFFECQLGSARDRRQREGGHPPWAFSQRPLPSTTYPTTASRAGRRWGHPVSISAPLFASTPRPGRKTGTLFQSPPPQWLPACGGSSAEPSWRAAAFPSFTPSGLRFQRQEPPLQAQEEER